MNKYLLTLLALSLAACSSSPKSESVATSDPQEGLADVTEPPPKKAQSQPLPPVVAEQPNTAAPNTDRLNSQLNAAIQKQDDRAIAIAARELLIRTPNDVKALNALALYHYRHGELDLSKSLLNKAIATDPNVSMLHSNLGMIFQTQNEMFDAIRSYREALKIDPYNPIASANLGAIYAKEKDYRKAQVALEMAVQKGQRDWRTLSNYGVSLMALGKYQASEPFLKKASELQPQNSEVLLNYAILLIDHLAKPSEGLDVISKIRYAGPGPELRKKISDLENRAKSVLK